MCAAIIYFDRHQFHYFILFSVSRVVVNWYVRLCCNFQDSPLTNAGKGSSLTLSGTVECDASIMEGETLTFGAVGAVSGMGEWL